MQKLFITLSLLLVLGQTHAQERPEEASKTEAAQAEDILDLRFDVHKYKLENGMTVLLHQDHSVPQVSHQLFFRVGSKDEEPGYTGIAHLFEHMMFKGAKKYKGDEYFTKLKAYGAEVNAWTSQDLTNYYVKILSSQLELVMDLESDRLAHLQLNQENLNSEREVVKEERRVRIDNSIRGILNEALWSTLFKVHPYRWPVVGEMKDLGNITVEKCKDFFNRFYAPNNAVLVIAGDFEIEETKGLVAKYYGPLKSFPVDRPERSDEPQQSGQRRSTRHKDVQAAMFSVAFKTAPAGDKDGYALDILSNLLGDGESSRLVKRLVNKEQTVTSAYSYHYGLKDAGVFVITASLKPKQKPSRVLRSIYSELWKFRNRLVSEKELQKAQNQITKSYVDSIKTIHGKASLLGLNEAQLGDYEVFFRDLNQYAQVTPKDIRRVAKKYLKKRQSSVVTVKPKKK